MTIDKVSDADLLAAGELFRQGEVRLSITQYRKGLRFEIDPLERAKAYLELARIYRISVRMKNARLELTRAFAELGLQWPKNNWTSLLASIVDPEPLRARCPSFELQERKAKIRLVAELYEELGLSAYYLRQIPTLLQSILRIRGICQELGPSASLLNWYGGAACIASLLGLRARSLRWIGRCLEVSTQLTEPVDQGKALIWHALLQDYDGHPVRSAELFEQCLARYGADLYPFDLRMTAVTLSINYLARGHYEQALVAMKTLTERYAYFRAQGDDDWRFDSAAWYTLAPKVMLGQMDDVEKMAHAFRSILTVDKDEKWLLAHYLGQLLIAGRKTGLEAGQVEDLISRFEVLDMSARGTHMETAFYWIAAAYSRFDLAVNDRAALPRFRVSLKKLGQTPRHPTARAHFDVLTSALAWLDGRQRVYTRSMERATQTAKLHDNRWALTELNQLQLRMKQAGGFR